MRRRFQSNANDRFPNAMCCARHRGPDGQGEYQDGNLWLAHTRLSILDLSDAGSQPMKTADERFVISYNGEVYNFRELAARHSLDGLRSSSDTEVVLRLFAKLGVRSLTELNGMFAFAVYDREKGKLWLARDRLGIKPLYYRLGGDRLTFASEIKSILALEAEPARGNISALHEWLYYGNPLGGRTLYDGVFQLLPGHYLELDLESFEHTVVSYWSLAHEVSEARIEADRPEVVHETRRLLEEAVRRQLVSDVPVGVFLSGGVDSSAITAFASRHYPGRLATYSVGFDFSRDGGELPRARQVANVYGTNHHELHIGGGNIEAVVEKMICHHDMPFSDAANIPLYLMAEELRGYTKVVLQGDGGDELFGGYRRYSTLRYYRALHLLALAYQRVDRLEPKSTLHYRIQRHAHAFGAENLATTMALLLTNEDRASNPLGVFLPPMARRVAEAADAFARYRELQPLFADQDIRDQMSLLDMSIVLPDTYLEKVDRATMAASLEVRVPFLDNELVSYVARLPGRVKMPFGRKKWLLKQALKGIVPNEVLYSPKRGFSVPFGSWLTTSLKQLFFDNLSAFEQRQPGIVDVKRINGMFIETSNGRCDRSSLLWKVMNLLIWMNQRNATLIEAA